MTNKTKAHTVIKFRIVIDHEDDVFRDIEMLNGHTFEDFHTAIKESFKFEGSEMASFYLSNDEWEKGQEVSLVDMSHGMDADTAAMVMDETKLEDAISSKNQKLVYVYDFLVMWCFFIEVLEIFPAKNVDEYPKCTNSYGTAPDQNSKSPADLIIPVESSASDPDYYSFDDEDYEDPDDYDDEFGSSFDNFNLN